MSTPKNNNLNASIRASKLPRRPVGKDGYYYECIVCNTEGELLCCETCPNTFHLGCLTPQLKSVPEGDWHCGSCLATKTPRRRLIKMDSPAGKLHPLDEATFDVKDQNINDVGLKSNATDKQATSSANGLKVYMRRRSKK